MIKYGIKRPPEMEKEIEEILKMAENTGAKIITVDPDTEIGEQFMSITKDGVGGILRWPIT